MKGDILLVILVFVFIFVIWVYTGGPSRPISFAGPYLTPVTTSGDESEAYWGNASGERFWGSVFNNSANDSVDATLSGSGQSAISLSGGNVDASDTDDEYVVVRNSGDAAVSLSGWKLRSEKSGVAVTIPQGERIARESGLSGIVLGPGEEAIITTGSGPVRNSFAETICTGYLDSSDRFSPSLNNQCPAPLDELGSYYDERASTYDKCADYVASLPSCTEARSVPKSIPASCEDFVDDRLSYRGCVSAHKNDDNFYLGSWRVFLDQSRQLWRSSNESIILIDASGAVVDRYAY